MEWAGWIGAQLGSLRPEVSVPPSARTRIHRFHIGGNRLLAFERNINYQMSEELKQSGGNEPLEKPVDIEAQIKNPGHVYDLCAKKYLGETGKIQFKLDPWRPALFAITTNQIPVEEG